MRDWRIKFDTPKIFALERGCIYSRYSPDFRNDRSAYEVQEFKTWQCPASTVLMLQPNFRDRDFGSSFRGLGSFRKTEGLATFWRSIAKSQDGLTMFSNLKPAGETKFIEALTVTAGIATINASDAFFDNLEWALESLQPIPIDGSFAIHYHGLTDELLRKNNWLYVQWDNIGIHISMQGHVRVLRYYDRGNLATDFYVEHEFDIAEPGELLGKSGYFSFIPIPGRGLAMYHSKAAGKQDNFSANASNFATRGSHLIPWTPRYIGTHYRLFESSLIRIALNPFHANVIGFQDITFAASGSFMDDIFDPKYRPTQLPSDVSPGVLQSFSENFATVGVTLKNNDGSVNWTAGTHRQGRILFDLSTSDDRYTPFVYGWGVQWLPVTQTRDTTEIIVKEAWDDVIQYMELTDDSEGNFEGTARLKVQSEDFVRIAERGTATFQVEYSEDGGTEWIVYNGGIAKFEQPLVQEYSPDWGLFYWAEVTLCDMHERFREGKNSLGTAFNSRTIAESINLVLTTSGFSQIVEDDFPASLFFRTLPDVPEGGGAQFPLSPNGGDSFEKILRVLLALASQQYLEFMLYYDWGGEEWAIAERARETEEPWILTYNPEDEDHTERIARYEDLKTFPLPPEGNVLVVSGLTDSDTAKAKKIYSDPIYNIPSQTDPESVDYLGWVDSIEVEIKGLTDQSWIDIAARQIEPRVLHRTEKNIVSIPAGHANLAIVPNMKMLLRKPPVQVNHGEDDREVTRWVKQCTLIIRREEHGDEVAGERMVLHLDEKWENEWKGFK